MCENMTSSTKPEMHNVNATPLEEDRATATTGNMQKNRRGSAVRFSSYANGETDKRTDILIAIIRTAPRGRSE